MMHAAFNPGLVTQGVNFRTSLMILKVLDKRINSTIGAYGTASAALAAWAYAQRNGARVIHNRCGIFICRAIKGIWRHALQQ